MPRGNAWPERERPMPVVNVRIPTPLRTLTGGKDEVQAEGHDVRELIENLEKAHPGLRDRLCDDKGVRRFVNIYANEEDIRFLENLDTRLKECRASSAGTACSPTTPRGRAAGSRPRLRSCSPRTSRCSAAACSARDGGSRPVARRAGCAVRRSARGRRRR